MEIKNRLIEVKHESPSEPFTNFVTWTIVIPIILGIIGLIFMAGYSFAVLLDNYFN